MARYVALKAVRPRSESNIVLYDKNAATPYGPPQIYCANKQCPIPQWTRFNDISSGDTFTTTFNRIEPFWTCDAGLLVYLDPFRDCYVISGLDPSSENVADVPFDCEGRLVRRIRLAAGLLVIEWAEEEPYHQLNDVELVHRHFVTAFDVTYNPSRVQVRNEWKLHFLGFPLNSHDLWFSAHSDTHYAVYIWQPNRSAWGEDEPIESLLVWDISQPSDYRPSLDPSGGRKPPTGPQMVKSLSYKDLDHLNLRQRDHPAMHALGIDDGTIYFHEIHAYENSTQIGSPMQADHNDLYWKRIVGIPIVGSGPPWTRGWKTDILEDCGELEHPCQNVRDGIAGVGYTIGMSNRKLWLCTEHQDWCSALEIEEHDDWYPWISVYAEERWLVMQCERDGVGELRILRFGHYPGDKGFALE